MWLFTQDPNQASKLIISAINFIFVPMNGNSVTKAINHFKTRDGLGRFNAEGLSQIVIDKNLKHQMPLADRH